MAKYLRYIEFTCSTELYKEFEKEFSKIQPFLSRIYEYYICPIPTISTAKIFVFIDPNIKPKNIEIKDNVIGFLDVFIGFDKNYFRNLEKEERLLYIQSLYLESIEFIAKKQNWKDVDILPEKHQSILNKKLLFRDYFKKPKSSPNRKYKVQFYFEYDSLSTMTYISVIEKEKIEKRIPFATNSYCLFYGNSVKNFEWIDNENIKINFSNNRDFWTINVVSEKVEFHYPRIEKNDFHSYYDLGLIYLSGSLIIKDYEKGIYYLKKSAGMNHKRAIRKLEEITGGNNV